MELHEIENRLRELLLPVFGLETVDDVCSEHSLVRDLGAESLDFVEIMYIIERNFGVVLKTREIILGGAAFSEEQIFEDVVLTDSGAALIAAQFPNHAADIRAGLTKIEMYSLITVQDMAAIIRAKMSVTS
jgi:acyl carrier protein